MFRSQFFAILILGSLVVVKACDPVACGAVTAGCAGVCACDLPVCECCPACLACVGALWDQCCDCFDLCGAKNESLYKKDDYSHEKDDYSHKKDDDIKKVDTSLVSIENKFPQKNASKDVIELLREDIVVVNKTKNSVCLTTKGSNTTLNSTVNYGYCSMGCQHCGYMCEQLYGLHYMCCQDTYCCCYKGPAGAPCQQPGVSCVTNYC